MLFPVFLAILIFLFGSKVIYAAENTEKEADRVQEALFEEFDFSKLDQEMKTLFPDEKLSFREILMQLISENGGSTAGTVVQFIKEIVFYLDLTLIVLLYLLKRKIKCWKFMMKIYSLNLLEIALNLKEKILETI